MFKPGSDLEKFKKLFYGDKFKVLRDGIEYRCNNLDVYKENAKNLIKRHNLKLEAITEDDMAARNAFLVREIKD